jgi:hypothetical protein
MAAHAIIDRGAVHPPLPAAGGGWCTPLFEKSGDP